MKKELSEPLLLNPQSQSNENITLDSKEPSRPPNLFELAESDLSKVNTISFFKLFMFSTPYDYFLIVFGTIFSIGNGLLMPAYSIIFGNMTNNIGPESTDLMSEAKKYSFLYLIIGGVGLILSFGGLSFWMLTGERQNICFRREYFRALIRQDISWFDSINPNQLTTKIANDTTAIQSAIGEKFSSLFYIITMFIAGYAVGLYWNWKLTLVLAASIFPMMFSGGFFGWSVEKGTSEIKKAYEKSGGFAEQALNAIRTVVSLTGEDKEWNNYVNFLSHTKKTAIKWGVIMGISLGFLFFCMFGEYALGLWYGSILIDDPNSNVKTGDVLVVFFAVTTGTFTLGQLTPCIKAFTEAKKALQRVVWLIERHPEINIENPTGKILTEFKGEIRFNNVSFSYPLREKIKVLDSIDLVFEPGMKTALVGESGCGKSTCMQLLERFYDPTEGEILLDDINLKDIQLASLRHNLGYVGQEPVLFGTSIIENLRFGKLDATYEEIINATKQANAHEFIVKLEKGFDTFVGPGGTQLSGGQKQRIAIARAILKNPKILLLDEATSALDRKNEMEIQKTLDFISKGRTTIVIAHRLSTIQNADKIIVIEKGKIAEIGKHDDLIANNGAYQRIQKNQIIQKDDKKEIIIEEEEEKELASLKIIKRSSTKKNWDSFHNLDEVRLTLKKSQSEQKRQDELDYDKENDHANDLIKKYDDRSIFRRLYSVYNKEILMFYSITTVFSLFNGAILPTFSIIFSEMLDVLNDPYASDFSSRCSFLCWMFFMIAALSFIFRIISFWSSFVAAEILSLDLRRKLYRKMLSLHIGWFDDSKNSAGTLTTRLQADVQLINELTSSILSIIIEASSSLITGMVIAFVYSWQISICIVFTTPLILFCAKIQEEMNNGFSKENDKAYKESAGLITESVNNMRTVASFGNDNKLLAIYDLSLEGPKTKLFRKSLISGIIYGCSIFITFAIYALSYYVGILFMSKGDVNFKEMYCAIFALMFAAFGSGAASQYMPDVGKAKNAAREVYEIMDTECLIKNNVNALNPQSKDEIKGKIEFKNVSFKYPSRDHQVFKNFNLIIEAGTKVALVGASGCGKSTVVSLLLRFYDVDEGEILLDGINIKNYNMRFLRRCFGIVSQEPVLFNGTINYNIKYVRENAKEEEVREAAKNANALEFIEKNQFETGNIEDNNENYGKGFNRLVGPKGSQISGGQKQRIAIARAILSQPKILLLDEATSALDSKNEQIVQESLDNIMKGYTSIAIAHRLSTIKDANMIYVLDDGNIVEKGTFENLMEKKGVFWALAEGVALHKDQ